MHGVQNISRAMAIFPSVTSTKLSTPTVVTVACRRASTGSTTSKTLPNPKDFVPTFWPGEFEVQFSISSISSESNVFTGLIVTLIILDNCLKTHVLQYYFKVLIEMVKMYCTLTISQKLKKSR